MTETKEITEETKITEIAYFLGKINTLSEILFGNIQKLKTEKNISKEIEKENFKNIRSIVNLIIEEILKFQKGNSVIQFFTHSKESILENEAVKKLEYFKNIEKFFKLENIIIYFCDLEDINQRIVNKINSFLEKIEEIECE